MVTRKEDTPKRLASRKYEEKNKDKRKATSGNFQTMIPRELFEKINAFLKEYGYTKVELIQAIACKARYRFCKAQGRV